MPTSKKDLANPRTIDEMKKEGRGVGEHEHYKPWLNVENVSSLGMCHRIPGWKANGRPIHLLSNLELNFFYMMEWDPEVVDFREQYPLDMALTQEFAARANIKHPAINLQKQSLVGILKKNPDAPRVGPIVMTTDALVTMSDNTHRAYAIKPKGKLDGKGAERVQEKLDLEEMYWKACGVGWTCITEDEINLTLARNVSAVHPYFFLQWFAPLSSVMADQVEAWLTPRLESDNLADLARGCDLDLALPPGASLVLAKHLIAHRRLPVDFTLPFEPDRPLNLLCPSVMA